MVGGERFAGEIAPLALLIFGVTGVVGAYVGRTLFVRSVDQIGASRAQSLNNASPIWSAQPIVSLFLAKTTLKGIEEVSFKDGAAAALVVAGVLVLRLG